MKLLVTVAAAAVVATMLHTAPGAQAPQTPPQPPPQGAPQPPPQTATPPPAPAPGSSADRRRRSQQVTIVGCAEQKESDYRQAQNKGRWWAGPAPASATGDEFVLTNASMATQGLKSEAAAADTAFELTGANEEKVKDFVGKRVQITGKLKGRRR